jgi:hypothetical protein
MPEILAMLASRAASDPGAIGKTVKTILADFKVRNSPPTRKFSYIY